MKKIGTSLFLFLWLHCSLSAQNWQQWGNGSSRDIYILFTDTVADTLYACNREGSSYGVVRWDGADWEEMGLDFNTPVSDMVRFDGRLCVSSGNSVHSWDGTMWNILGGELNSTVTDMEVFQNKLHVCGFWGNLVRLDGDEWVMLNPLWTLFPTPKALQVYKEELYVAGSFESSNGNHIIRWDGENWSGLGNGISSLYLPEFDLVFSEFAIYNDELYLSSNFLKHDGNPDDYIARWNGDSWYAVGGGLNDNAFGFTIYNSELYALGRFTLAGWVPVPRVAKWDGSQWCDLGSTFNGSFGAMTVYNDELILGGSFDGIDGVPINRIAKWIGGDYVDSCSAMTGIGEQLADYNEIALAHPNPSTGPFTLSWEATAAESYSLLLYDAQGRTVHSQSGQATAGRNAMQLELSHLPSGIYFGRLAAGEEVRSFNWMRL